MKKLFEKSKDIVLETIKDFNKNVVDKTKEVAEKGTDVITKIGKGGLESVGIYDETFKVFIAGSTSLFNYRNAVRSAFQQIMNRTNTKFEIITYEDFTKEFTINGHQNKYNQYISEKADYVIFIIDKNLGPITEEEFRVALNAYQKNKKPHIYIFCKNQDINIIETRTKNFINEHKQYYLTFKDEEDLMKETKIAFLESIFKEMNSRGLINRIKGLVED